jgi:hypothetical protein
MKDELKICWYDWAITGFGAFLLFTKLKDFGIFILAFMIAFYLSEKAGRRK